MNNKLSYKEVRAFRLLVSYIMFFGGVKNTMFRLDQGTGKLILYPFEAWEGLNRWLTVPNTRKKKPWDGQKLITLLQMIPDLELGPVSINAQEQILCDVIKIDTNLPFIRVEMFNHEGE